MSNLDLELRAKGARLYARQVMARAGLAEERAERDRQERAAGFWRWVKLGVSADVLAWPKKGQSYGN